MALHLLKDFESNSQMERGNTETFGVAFLDLICCALISTVILYTISPRAANEDVELSILRCTFQVDLEIESSLWLFAQFEVNGALVSTDGTIPASSGVTWDSRPGFLAFTVRGENLPSALPITLGLQDDSGVVTGSMDVPVAVQVNPPFKVAEGSKTVNLRPSTFFVERIDVRK